MTEIEFAKMIRVVRKTLGETQAEFGKRFGVSHAAVSYWEKGKDQAPYAVISFVIKNSLNI